MKNLIIGIALIGLTAGSLTPMHLEAKEAQPVTAASATAALEKCKDSYQAALKAFKADKDVAAYNNAIQADAICRSEISYPANADTGTSE